MDYSFLTLFSTVASFVHLHLPANFPPGDYLSIALAQSGFSTITGFPGSMHSIS